jgi:hypothetical protein
MGRSSRQRAQARHQRETEVAQAVGATSPPPPPSRWRRLLNRIKGVPGASFGLGLVQLLWHYAPFIFRRGEDADFVFDLWTKAGGDFPMLIQAITSPIFGLALIGTGIGYAIIAKEPEKSVPAFVPKIAWVIVGISGFLLGTAILFDQFLRESHISQYIRAIRRELLRC